MFEFLRKLFRKTPEKEEIRLKDLDRWFQEKAGPRYEEINSIIKEKFSEFSEEAGRLRESLDLLEKAEVKEPEKVPPKIRNVVKSHRSNYLRIMRQFLDRIEIPESGYSASEEFAEKLEKELDELGKSSAKSYYAVQHLFSAKVADIAKNLKNMGSILGEIKDVLSEKNLLMLEKLEKKIKYLVNSYKDDKRLDEEIKENKLRIKEINDRVSNLEMSRNKMKQSRDFLEIENNKIRIRDIEESFSKLDNKIADLFAPLESSLKKFKRVTLSNESIIDEYAKDPKDALFRDKELKILEIIPSMRKNIESGALGLSDRKKEKALENLEMINEEALRKIIEEHRGLLEKRESLQQSIENNDTLSKIKEIDHKISFYSNKAEVLEKEISALESEKNRLSIEIVEKDIEDYALKLFNIELKITGS